MRLKTLSLTLASAVLTTAVVFSQSKPSSPPQNATNSALYSFRDDHDADGIGKFYQGREIAFTCGDHNWLERPTRETEEKTDLLIEALHLKPGEIVADVGAGTGYISRKLAVKVGERGTVYAEDIQTKMLGVLTNKLAKTGIHNIKPVLGTTTDAKLTSGSVDTILMVDVYHEFDQPYEMMDSICRALKPGGRVVFVEYRAEDPNVPIKRLHKMSVAQVKKEMMLFPLAWKESIETLPRQHILIFQKTDGKRDGNSQK